MREPETGMMRVVRFFPGDVLDERILPREVGAGVAHQGIEAWNAGISVILGEELPVDEHLQVFVLLFEIDGDTGGKGNSREQ